jgi:hypothetical protein
MVQDTIENDAARPPSGEVFSKWTLAATGSLPEVIVRKTGILGLVRRFALLIITEVPVVHKNNLAEYSKRIRNNQL